MARMPPQGDLCEKGPEAGEGASVLEFGSRALWVAKNDRYKSRYKDDYL
jgi:hypothetical protein